MKNLSVKLKKLMPKTKPDTFLKRKLNFKGLTLICILLLVPQIIFATAYHTITIDANLGEWSSDEDMPVQSTVGGFKFYFTWNGTYFYVGVNRNGSFGNNDQMYVYIDTDPDGSSGTTSPVWGTHTLPFNADQVIIYKPGGGPYFVRKYWTGASWSADQSTGGSQSMNWSSGLAEFSFTRSAVGNPSKIKIIIYLEDDSSNWAWSVTPKINPNNGQGLSFYAYWRYDCLKQRSWGTAYRLSPNKRKYLWPGILISEVNADSSPGEYVVLYNPTDWWININNLRIDVSSGDYIFGSVNFRPHSYYLISDTNPVSGVTPDVITGLGITDNGASSYVRLWWNNNSANIVDCVGWRSSGTPTYYEGNNIPNGGSSGQSIKRKPNDATDGNSTDTDDNANDFLGFSTARGGTAPAPRNNSTSYDRPATNTAPVVEGTELDHFNEESRIPFFIFPGRWYWFSGWSRDNDGYNDIQYPYEVYIKGPSDTQTPGSSFAHYNVRAYAFQRDSINDKWNVKDSEGNSGWNDRSGVTSDHQDDTNPNPGNEWKSYCSCCEDGTIRAKVKIRFDSSAEDGEWKIISRGQDTLGQNSSWDTNKWLANWGVGTYSFIIDTTAPGNWQSFYPNYQFQSNQTPNCSVQVQDTTSGLALDGHEYVNTNYQNYVKGLWHLDPEEGTVANYIYDSSGNSNHGTGYNINWGEENGFINRAHGHNSQDFTGAAGCYVKIPYSSSLDFSGKSEITVEAWINADATGAWDRIIAQSYYSGSQYGCFELSFDNANHLRVLLNIGGTWRAVTSSGTVSTGAWHHVAFTYDGTTLRLFLDGVQVGSGNWSGTISVTSYGGSSQFPICFGDSMAPDNSVNNENFDGKIDEVRILDKALDRGEIWLDATGEGAYRYSTDGGNTWSDWLPATMTGADGTTAFQTITATNVPFNQNSSTNNKIQFMVRDRAQNVGISSVYNVNIYVPSPLDVVINEIAWGGTQDNSQDHWIELYNNTSYTIYLDGWDINDDNGASIYNLSGYIPPNGYYLIEDNGGGASGENCTSSNSDLLVNLDLADTGDSLLLRNIFDQIIDAVNPTGGGWPAGTSDANRRTMERINPLTTGSNNANWANNDMIIRNGTGSGGTALNGTPKAGNSASVGGGLSAYITPNSPSNPQHHQSIGYVDEVIKSDANTIASVKIELPWRVNWTGNSSDIVLRGNGFNNAGISNISGNGSQANPWTVVITNASIITTSTGIARFTNLSIYPRSSGALEFVTYCAKAGDSYSQIDPSPYLYVGAYSNDITISEIAWRDSNNPNREWFELYNTTGYTLGVGGFMLNDKTNQMLTDKYITLSINNQFILPHSFYLIERSGADPTSISADYTITSITKFPVLENGGDFIWLTDMYTNTIDLVDFKPNSPWGTGNSGWPAGASSGGDTDGDGYNDGVSMERINLTNDASVSNNWKNGPGAGAASESNEGGLGNVAGTPRGPNTPNIDGNPNDWIGIPAGTNMAIISYGEWIWTDNTNDQRNNLSQTTNNLDIKEVRVRGDKGYVYFLIRTYQMTQTNLQHFAIAWDTDRSAGDSDYNWIGADSDTTLGHNRQYFERMIDPHYRNSQSDWDVEMWAGSSWYTPPGNYQIAASSKYNCIELKINRSDLVADRPSIRRLTMGILKNTGNDNSGGNGTVDIAGSSDFIDVITPSFQNTWSGDISDGDIDFWFDIKFQADGTVASNLSPPTTPTMIWPSKSTQMNIYTGSNYYNPTIKFHTTNDPDGDTVWFYQVQVSTTSNSFLSGLFEDALRYPDLGGTWTNYQMNTTCTDEGDYYVRVRAYDQYGRASAWTPVYGIHYPAAKRKVDGNSSDWLSLSAPTNSFITNSEEWGWLDRLNDERLNLMNMDISEFRITADSRFLYIMTKFRDINNGGLPMICITINTDGNNPSGIGWIGDDSLGSGEGSGSIPLENTNQFGQLTLDISYDGVFIFTNNGTSWFKSSDKGNQVWIDTSNDVLEARVPLYDLKFTSKSLTNLNVTVISFQRQNTTPNGQDHTDNVGGTLIGNDGVDVLAPQYKDAGASDLYDNKAYYYYNLSFKSDGNPAPNRRPNRPTLIAPPDGTTTPNDPTLIWNKVTDPDGDKIKFYHIQISTNIPNDSPPFSDLIDNLEITTTNTNCHLDANYFIEGQTYRWRVRAYDEHGFCSEWSVTNTFTVGTFRITVDGDTNGPNDWKGVAPRVDIDSWVISSNEFIWIDNINDERKDGTDPDSDYDMVEFRVVADTNQYSDTKGNFFFLVKFNSYSGNQRFNINIAIRTNQTSNAGAQNWMGDDAEVNVNETKSQPDFNINWCYDGENDIYTIPNYTTGSGWDRPHSYKSYLGKITECRISADSFGLDIKNSPTITIRVAIGEYTNAGDPDFPDNAEKNKDVSGSADFLDCMNPGSGRGYNNKDGTWWDEMQDADYDFWVKLKFDNNGDVIKATAKGMNSTTDEDNLKDNYPSIKFISVSPYNTSITDFVELYCERDGNNSGGLNLQYYRFADNEGVFKTIGNATINSGEIIRLNMGSGTDETTAGADGVLNLYAGLDNARLGPNDKIEFLTPYTNDGVRSAMDAVCWQSNQTGIFAPATNIYYAGEWWTNMAYGALEYTNLTPDTSYFIRKTNNGQYVDSNKKSDWTYKRFAYYVNDAYTGADIWCSATGSDTTGTGSPSAPYATITKIITNFQLNAGDIIYVDNGVYNDQINITSADTGTNNSYLVVTGAGTNTGKNSIINGSAYGIKLANTKWIKLIGLAITNSVRGIYVSNSSYVSIVSNEIYNNITNQILVEGKYVTNIRIANNTIYRIPDADTGDKIEINGVKNSVRIYNNTIYGGNYKAGVKLDNSKNISVSHNTIYSNWYGVFVEYSTNNLIYTNYLYQNAKEGIYLINASVSNTILSNTIYSNGISSGIGGVGIYLLGPNVKFNNVAYNKIYNNDLSSGNNDNLKIEAPYNNAYNNIISSSTQGKGIVLITPNCYSNNVYNNTLYSNNYALWVQYCKLNNITGNTLYRNKINSYAVYMGNSTNNYFAQNYFWTNFGSAIQIDGNSISNKIWTNTFKKIDQRGIQVLGDKNSIKGNKIYRAGWQGIVLEYSAEDNIVRDNTIGTNGGGDTTWHAGILVISGAYSNQIINNQCFSNHPYGISIINSSGAAAKNNTVQSNTCYNNDMYGIRVHGGTNNFIYDNKVYNNQYGIYLEVGSSKNIVKGNIAKNNFVDGIYLNNSPVNRIVRNYALTNTSNNGITFDNSANNNYCASNISSYNAFGIRINNTSGVTLYRNAVYHNNGHGIWLTDGDNCIIHHNSVASNDQFGNYDNLRIDLNSTGNEVINNIFAYAKLATGYGINIESGGSATLKYNNVYGNASGNYSGVASPGSGSISNAPQWLSYNIYSTNFLYLTNTSPCIDMGTNLGYSYVGAAPDMGWKEYDRPYVHLSVSKTVSNVSLNSVNSSAIPGSTVFYKIEYQITGNTNANYPIIYDKIPANTTYLTDFLGTATGWTVEYSTNDNPVQTYNSSSYSTNKPADKSKIKWIRWKKPAESSGTKTLFYKVVIE